MRVALLGMSYDTGNLGVGCLATVAYGFMGFLRGIVTRGGPGEGGGPSADQEAAQAPAPLDGQVDRSAD